MFEVGKTEFYKSAWPVSMNYMIGQRIAATTRNTTILDKRGRQHAMLDPVKADDWWLTVAKGEGRILWIQDVSADEEYWLRLALTRTARGVAIGDKATIVVTLSEEDNIAVAEPTTVKPEEIVAWFTKGRGDRFLLLAAYMICRKACAGADVAVAQACHADTGTFDIMCEEMAYNGPASVAAPVDKLPADLDEYSRKIYEKASEIRLELY